MSSARAALSQAQEMLRAPKTLSARTLRWYIIVLAICGFEAFVRLGYVKPTEAAPPSLTLVAMLEAVRSGEAARALGRTGVEVVGSFAAAVVIGIPLGALLGRSGLVRGVVQPVLITLYAVPLIFFYPLLLAAFGIGAGPVVAVAIPTGIVPLALNTMVGFLEVQGVWIKTARAFGARGWQMLTKVYFPGAAPFVFSGVRQGLIYITIAVVAMEFVTADAGLGYMARYYKELFRTPQTYAYISFVFLISVATDYLLRKLESRARRGEN